MRLYFNGCSHTYGDDLADPSTQSWPAVIAKSLGCEFDNDSVSGGSNDRIRYRLLKMADHYDKIYLAWTYTTRFTRYRSDNNHEVNFNPQLNHSLYGDSDEFRLYGKIHYTTWHNELFAFKLWLQDIVLVQRYLASKNKRYVMLNTHHNHIDRWSSAWQNFNDSVKSLLCFDTIDDDQLYSEHREIQSLLAEIDHSRFIGWNQWWLTQMLDQYPVSNTGHLLEQGHKATAEYILEHDPD